MTDNNAQARVGTRPEAPPDRRRWMVLVILLVATFMDLLDVTIVAIAVPSIQQDISATYTAAQWVLAGYSLAFALLLITGGRLGDIIGRKRMFLLGMGGFTVASALCGLAPNPELLIASRVLQGAMAAMMVPQVISSIQVMFSPKERVAAFSVYGGVAGLATVSGPLLGGLLIKADLFDLGWRAIFLINVPIGLAALVGALVLMKELRTPHALRLDLTGVGIITVTMLLLVYPLMQGREKDWPTWIFAMMAASAVGLVVFAAHQRRRSGQGGSPLVPMELFKEKAFVGGLLVNLVFFAGIVSFFLVFIIYLQAGLDKSVLAAAMANLPWSVGIALASGASFQLAPKLGRTVLHIGTGLMTASMVAIILTIQFVGTDVSVWHFVPSMFVGGVGMGLVAPLLVDAVISGVPHHEAGSASGVLSAVQQVGGALGIALIGVIFFGLLGDRAQGVAEANTAPIRAALQSAGAPVDAQRQAVDGFVRCFVDRSAEEDPTAVPVSCRDTDQAAPAAVTRAYADAATDARRELFSDAMKLTAWYNAGVFLLAFLLVFGLPRRINVHAEAEAGLDEDAPAEPVDSTRVH